MKLAVELVFGVEPAIEELATMRAWDSVGKARLGAVRLFGKSRARFRLNGSALGQAPLRGVGNPDADPLRAEAWRVRVLTPPAGPYGPITKEELSKVVEAQKPAHIRALIRVGSGGFLLSTGVAAGIDTILTAPAKPVLGSSGNVRLRSRTVLWSGKNQNRLFSQVGRTTCAARL
jgi:hypothetical protein